MAIQPSDGAPRLPVTSQSSIVPLAQAPAAARPAAAGDRLELGRGADRPLSPADKQLLDEITAAHLRYFTQNSDPKTGLTRDRSRVGSASSVAAVGFSLTAHGVAIHRGLMSRQEGASYTLKALRTLDASPAGASLHDARHHGFFYHFLEPATARRAGKSELSTVDTALLMAGVLFSRNFYDGDSADEQEIRAISTRLYRQVDWQWALNGGDKLALGWHPEKGWLDKLADVWSRLTHPFNKQARPESGFLMQRWGGYNEGMLMVLMGMGSPTHPLPANAWSAFHRGERHASSPAGPYAAFGPMFGHQYSHAWIDFRGIQDEASRKRGYDWAENSTRAALAQVDYARQNPGGFRGYGERDWGLTASDGPGKQAGEGFRGYLARGVGSAPDDGTIAPTAAAASLPFAPEPVLATLRHWREDRPELWGPQGFTDAFNPSADPGKPSGWVDPDRIGIDQGPIVLMTENFRSGFVWEVMKRDPDLRRGLERAGFTGGWLGS